MLRPTAVLVALFLLVPTSAAPPPKEVRDKPKDDKAALQGSWRVVHQTLADDFRDDFELLVFKGDRVTFHYRLGEEAFEAVCTFKLEPAADPKQFDFTCPKTGKGLGLYVLTDGLLRVCYRGSESTRPRDFKDKRDGNSFTEFLTLKREPAHK